MFRRLFFVFIIIFCAANFLSVADAAGTGPIGRWRFDEESGTIAYDSSGNGNDGTLEGDPQWVVGKINGALEFDGVGDYVNCGNSPVLQIQNQITMACWFRVAIFSRNWATILSMGDDSYRLSRGESNYSLHMGFNGTTSSPYSWFDGRQRVNDDQWHHVAGVYDGTEARIYIDGELDASQLASGQINASDYDLYIGENAQAFGRFWNGFIDDVRIYDRALSEEEIQIVMTGVDISPELAYKPNPADEAIDVSRDTVLSWSPGEFADKHDVYFGTNSDSVSYANRTDQLGVLFSQDYDFNSIVFITGLSGRPCEFRNIIECCPAIIICRILNDNISNAGTYKDIRAIVIPHQHLIKLVCFIELIFYPCRPRFVGRSKPHVFNAN